MQPGKVGRRPADRRVPVRRPGSPYFRTAGNGVIVARPAAIEQHDVRTNGGAGPSLRIWPALVECRGIDRAALQAEGARCLLKRQPLIGRLCDRGDPVHLARRTHRDVRTDRAHLGADRGGPGGDRRVIPADDPCVSQWGSRLHRRAREPRASRRIGRGRCPADRLRAHAVGQRRSASLQSLRRSPASSTASASSWPRSASPSSC